MDKQTYYFCKVPKHQQQRLKGQSTSLNASHVPLKYLQQRQKVAAILRSCGWLSIWLQTGPRETKSFEISKVQISLKRFIKHCPAGPKSGFLLKF